MVKVEASPASQNQSHQQWKNKSFHAVIPALSGCGRSVPSQKRIGWRWQGLCAQISTLSNESVMKLTPNPRFKQWRTLLATHQDFIRSWSGHGFRFVTGGVNVVAFPKNLRNKGAMGICNEEEVRRLRG
jgi:hypothetical protein